MDLAPPGVTTIITADSVLVIAPHFDDDVLGCGGLIAQLAAAGPRPVRIATVRAPGERAHDLGPPSRTARPPGPSRSSVFRM